TMAEELVGALPGVTVVDVKMTANMRPAFGNRPAGSEMLPGVKQTIAVASGKGGVGKSTVAVNLAASLVRTGARVGLLDADIYGPSIPGLTGVHEQPRVVEKPNSKGEMQKRLVPLEAWGIKMMSIGFIAGESTTAMVWRGPMVSRAIEQMMQDVDWGELDYLVIDLPPGTGDASLTIGQARSEKPNSTGEMQKRLVPLEAWGIKMMSIGFIAGESTTAMVWRGPMVSRAIEQMMQDVDWGELDYLVIDLPPGTGDASLTIGQA